MTHRHAIILLLVWVNDTSACYHFVIRVTNRVSSPPLTRLARMQTHNDSITVWVRMTHRHAIILLLVWVNDTSPCCPVRTIFNPARVHTPIATLKWLARTPVNTTDATFAHSVVAFIRGSNDTSPCYGSHARPFNTNRTHAPLTRRMRRPSTNTIFMLLSWYNIATDASACYHPVTRVSSNGTSAC